MQFEVNFPFASKRIITFFSFFLPKIFLKREISKSFTDPGRSSVYRCGKLRTIKKNEKAIQLKRRIRPK